MPASARPPVRRLSQDMHERLGVASRSLAAVFGGYLLANLFVLAFVRLVPMTPRDASQLALMLSFVVFALAAIVAFSTRQPGRAWAWILGFSAVCALIVWFVPGGAA